MAEEDVFDISFTCEGQQYTGWVNPSDKFDEAGKPVSFHVVLNDTSFGYLSYRNGKWSVNEQRPHILVETVGREILKIISP